MERPTKNDCPEEGSGTQVEMKLIPYRSIIGLLNYISAKTRPDITFAVNVLSRFCINPGPKHWTAAKRVLRYLKGTMEQGIKIKKNIDMKLVGYTDADWAQDTEDRKSTSGYIYEIGGAIISWKSKKQPTVALSTAEAEYNAIAFAMKEGLYLRNLLMEIGFEQKEPTMLYVDNQAAISWALNPVEKQRTKHIDLKYHFIREKVQDGSFVLKYCKTQDMAADMMTKPVGKKIIERNMLQVTHEKPI